MENGLDIILPTSFVKSNGLPFIGSFGAGLDSWLLSFLCFVSVLDVETPMEARVLSP